MKIVECAKTFPQFGVDCDIGSDQSKFPMFYGKFTLCRVLFVIAANRQMDVALYVGLTVACVVIGGLAFFLARLLRRKGRDHSLYSMARNGE